MERDINIHDWNAADLTRLRQLAKKWYLANQRDLPWRRTHDPYEIWVSEIMLQQTQVATVIPYYDRFLKSFPNILALATAPIDNVYHHWAGLGYYRRAKQMHEAAKVIQLNHHGTFPTDFKSVSDLPGVGRYTAGAVLSFSMDQKQPIVEANTQRLYARLLHLNHDTDAKHSQLHLWSFAERVLPAKSGSGLLNQALMEIGSQICLPKNPSCPLCPLKKLCPTFATGSQAHIPAPKPAKQYTLLREAALVIRDEKGRILMRRCAGEDRWAGLWDFPRFDVTNCKTASAESTNIAAQFSARFGKSVHIGAKIHELKHAVTRYRITLSSYEAELDSSHRSKWKSLIERRWTHLKELKDLALSASGKRLTERLQVVLSGKALSK